MSKLKRYTLCYLLDGYAHYKIINGIFEARNEICNLAATGAKDIELLDENGALASIHGRFVQLIQQKFSSGMIKTSAQQRPPTIRKVASLH